MNELNYRDINLNDQQMEAVKTIDGALLVVAGPGTGKTQLLSARVAEILTQTDTSAQNILCLTFTNKAALNMKLRVLKMTDGKARDVVIKTFHSFAAEIMNMYPDYFWNGAKLSVAPDAVQTEILQDILEKLPLDNPLAIKFYGKFTSIKDVKKAIGLAKEAGLTPEKLSSIISNNIAYINTVEPEIVDILSAPLSYKNLNDIQKKIDNLPKQVISDELSPLLPLSTKLSESLAQAINLDEPTNKTKNTGEWKKKIIQTINGVKTMDNERKRNDWWLKLSDVYKQYRDQLHRRGYYDYSDMLVEVITQLEKNDVLRADVQERFLYIMIDEFQDTNAAQLKLAHLVADHFTSEGNPNIMAVGDDDQSIFKFNGAELSNILHFKRSYPLAKTIVLKQNYRSGQKILDTSEKVMELADDRLVKRDPSLDKKLIAQKNAPKSNIQHRHYKTADEQFYDIANIIKKSYSTDKTIAVIARSHQSLMNIAKILLKNGVPLNYEQQRNILDHPIIEQIYNLSQICHSINIGDLENTNIFISKSLRHEMWGIDNQTLWQIAVDNYRDPDWLQYLSNSKNSNLSKIAEYLLELSNIVGSENIFVAFEYLIGLRNVDIRTNPIYDFYVKDKKGDINDYLFGLSAIKKLRVLVNEYSFEQNPNAVDFINFVISERNNGQIINDESPFVTGENAVNLLSVHKAKGLEFDEVYIIDATENNWSPNKGGRKSPINLPLQPILDEMDDYIRLMFVAITRAKSNLIISSYDYDFDGRETITTPLVSSAFEQKEIQVSAPTIEILESSLTWPRLQTNNEKTLLKSRLSDYSLSVTNLFNFLDVSAGGPQFFLERNLLRLPEVKSTSLAFGSSMHSALELAQKLINSDEFNLEKIKNEYKKALKSEHLTNHEYQRYFDHGTKLIDKLFDGDYLKLIKGSLPEQSVNDVFIGQARLSGKLDRLDVFEDKIIVSDYKTGSPLLNFQTKSESLQIKAWKQRTQLIFYALLLENSSRFNIKNKQIIGQMIYLEANTPKEFEKQYIPSRQEIDELSKLVEIVWHKITNLDLPDTSHYSSSYLGIQEFIKDLMA